MNLRPRTEDDNGGDDDLPPPELSASQAVIWTRLRIVEQELKKRPTNADARVLVLAAVVANQLIPTLDLTPNNPAGFVGWLIGWLLS